MQSLVQAGQVIDGMVKVVALGRSVNSIVSIAKKDKWTRRDKVEIVGQESFLSIQSIDFRDTGQTCIPE